jgi:hypothetical protein
VCCHWSILQNGTNALTQVHNCRERNTLRRYDRLHLQMGNWRGSTLREVKMQEKWRLKYRRDIILALDEERQRQYIHDDNVREMRANVVEQVVVKKTIPTLTPFEKYVQYVKEHTTELTCHHGKFHWVRCNACRRTDATQLWHLQKYYRNKIVKILSANS